MRPSALALLLALAGCSSQLPDGCDTAWTAAGHLRQCSSRADTAQWIDALPVVMADLAAVIPGVAELRDTVAVAVHDADEDAKIAGHYLGYLEPTPKLELFIRPSDSHEPRYTALAHEWIHAWEHLVEGVSYAEWSASETHFVNYDLAINAIETVQHPDDESEKCHPL